MSKRETVPVSGGASVSPLPPYPAYRPSGVEWLGEVPEHWEVMKINHCFSTIGSGTTPDTNEQEYYNGTIPWVTTSELRETVINDTGKKLTQLAFQNHSALRIFPEGSLLIAMYGATIGRLGILGLPACVNQACCALANPVRCTVPYTYYYLIAYRNQLIEMASGGGQPNISQDKVKQFRISIPPPDEQRAIAAYLDRETGEIDALTAKKERLIALLEEKRAALISHAVTRGLDLNAPTRPSGIEWLGEVPEHWSVFPLRRILIRIEQGWSPQAEERIADVDEWAIVKLSAVSKGRFFENENKALPKNLEPTPQYEIKPGDFLLSRANTPDLVGESCVVPNCRSRLIMADLIYRLTLQRSASNPSFISYFLRSSKGRYQITRDARGSSQSMVKIAQGHIKSWLIPIPPIDEQTAIVEYLDRETNRIDTLITKIRDHIKLLKERRGALIAAAVTGRFDARGAV